jgi:hypothetical protein
MYIKLVTFKTVTKTCFVCGGNIVPYEDHFVIYDSYSGEKRVHVACTAGYVEKVRQIFSTVLLNHNRGEWLQ